MINLTPHQILLVAGGLETPLPPSGSVARVATSEVAAGDIEIAGLRIPVIRREFGEIIGLPESDEPCVVSSLVLEAVRVQQPWRRRVYAPDTGPTAIRDAAGRVVAVTRLVAA